MKLKMLKEAQVEVSEEEIRKEFESNLGLIEKGLQYIDSLVRIGNGIIDTLAIDGDLRPVIIEFKGPGGSEQDALIQALDYYTWCKENLDWVEEYIRKSKPALLPEGKKLSEDVRIILIAKDFEDRIKRVCLVVEPEVKLISYSFFERTPEEVGLLPRIVLDSSEEKGIRLEIPTTISEHFEEQPELRPAFDELVSRIKQSVDPEIDVDKSKNIKAAKGYIGFWHKIIYMYLQVRRDYLLLSILGLASKLPNERIIPITARAWPPKQKWGRVKISEPKDVDDELISWIKEAYNLADQFK
ncbi:MAG: DUF5655 domain-containing protein [Candidatus Hadarchaeales archaeon]